MTNFTLTDTQLLDLFFSRGPNESLYAEFGSLVETARVSVEDRAFSAPATALAADLAAAWQANAHMGIIPFAKSTISGNTTCDYCAKSPGFDKFQSGPRKGYVNTKKPLTMTVMNVPVNALTTKSACLSCLRTEWQTMNGATRATAAMMPLDLHKTLYYKDSCPLIRPFTEWKHGECRDCNWKGAESDMIWRTERADRNNDPRLIGEAFACECPGCGAKRKRKDRHSAWGNQTPWEAGTDWFVTDGTFTLTAPDFAPTVTHWHNDATRAALDAKAAEAKRAADARRDEQRALTAEFTAATGFDPFSVGLRPRGWWVEVQDGEPTLLSEARDGASNPMDEKAELHPAFVTTFEDEGDCTYRYYAFRGLPRLAEFVGKSARY